MSTMRPKKIKPLKTSNNHIFVKQKKVHETIENHHGEGEHDPRI